MEQSLTKFDCNALPTGHQQEYAAAGADQSKGEALPARRDSVEQRAVLGLTWCPVLAFAAVE